MSAKTALRHDFRVLVVDEPDAADSLNMLLSLHGYDVKAVNTADEALAAVEPFRPEVILSEVRLARKNGLWLAGQLKGWGGVLVAVTGLSDPEHRRLIHEAGYQHHVVKGWPCNHILELVASLRQDGHERRGEGAVA